VLTKKVAAWSNGIEDIAASYLINNHAMTTNWRVKTKLLRVFSTWNLDRDVRFTSRGWLTSGKRAPGKPPDGGQMSSRASPDGMENKILYRYR